MNGVAALRTSVYVSRTDEATNYALQLRFDSAIMHFVIKCGVGISVLCGLPKAASDRNENLVFATVSHCKRMREIKLSRYLSGYKILYLQG